MPRPPLGSSGSRPQPTMNPFRAPNGENASPRALDRNLPNPPVSQALSDWSRSPRPAAAARHPRPALSRWPDVDLNCQPTGNFARVIFHNLRVDAVSDAYAPSIKRANTNHTITKRGDLVACKSATNAIGVRRATLEPPPKAPAAAAFRATQHQSGGTERRKLRRIRRKPSVIVLRLCVRVQPLIPLHTHLT